MLQPIRFDTVSTCRFRVTCYSVVCPAGIVVITADFQLEGVAQIGEAPQRPSRLLSIDADIC